MCILSELDGIVNVTPDTADDSSVETENWPVVQRLALIAGGILACCVGMLLYSNHQERRGQALELAIAKTPVGVSYAEAEQRVGRPPDHEEAQMGVFIHNGATFLSASNRDSARYGKDQMYDAHIWREGPVSATVMTDQEGLVAGRYSGRDRKRTSGPSLVQQLIRWMQS